MDEEKERAASDKTGREDSTKNGGKTVNKVPQAKDEVNNFDANFITDDTNISDPPEPLAGNGNNSQNVNISANLVNFSSLPSDLGEYNQWICWKLENDNRGRLTKVPYNARTSRHASSTNPRTWATRERVKASYRSGGYDGVGFVLTANDPFVCIDLDNVRDPVTGVIEPAALDKIARLNSYTEISWSGTGIHIWIRATKPGTDCKSKDGKFEVYSHSKFIATTGNKLPGSPEGVNSRQTELDAIYAEQFSGSTPTVESDANLQVIPTVEDLLLLPDAQPPQLKLEELLRCKAFCKVWEHKRADFPSLSEYDLSLADYAYKSGWTIQEYADLIIAFRHRWGGPDDVAKVLNPKYVQGRWAKVSQSSDAVALLPFKVKRLVQLGTEDAEYVLELEDGTAINMGETATFLSSRNANQKFYDAGKPLTLATLKCWWDIAVALRSLVVIIPTVTRGEIVGQWVRELISSRPPSLIDPDQADSLSSHFGSDRGHLHKVSTAVIDLRGRVYVHLSNSAQAMFLARLELGQSTTQRSLAADLANLGFRKLPKVSVYFAGVRKQINIWESPEGFISQEFIDGLTKDRKMIENE